MQVQSITNIHYGLPQNISLLILYVSQKIKKMPIGIEKQRSMEYNRTAWYFEDHIEKLHLLNFEIEYEGDWFLYMELRENDEGDKHKVRIAYLKLKPTVRETNSRGFGTFGMTQINLDITEELKQKLIEWQEE